MQFYFSSKGFLVSGGSSFSDWLELAGILILCIIVIAASYFVTKFIGTKQMGKQRNGNFKILEVCSVAPGKTLQLIQTGTRYLVLAVTKDSVTKLIELSEDEVVKTVREEKKTMAFTEMFEAFTKKNTSEGKDKAGSTTVEKKEKSEDKES